jgi:hypothetical protein
VKNTLIVYSTNRLIERETYISLLPLLAQGAGIIEQHGSPDVSYARIVALNLVMRRIRKEPGKFDTVLMIDDDMVFPTGTVESIVTASRKLGKPVSGCYVGAHGRICAAPYADTGLYLTGLGCLAIPAGMMFDLEAESASFMADDGIKLRQFTWSGVGHVVADGVREWIAEDFRLCMQLGGVHVLPIALGHVKKRILYPSDENMAEFLDPQKMVAE